MCPQRTTYFSLIVLLVLCWLLCGFPRLHLLCFLAEPHRPEPGVGSFANGLLRKIVGPALFGAGKDDVWGRFGVIGTFGIYVFCSETDQTRTPFIPRYLLDRGTRAFLIFKLIRLIFPLFSNPLAFV